MRTLLVVASVCALAPAAAQACECSGEVTVWPSGVQNVSRSAHVLLYGTGPRTQHSLLDLGPIPEHPTLDELRGRPEKIPGGTLVQAAQRLLRPADPTIKELAPAQPLAARHRFAVVAAVSSGSRVLRVFETGDGAAVDAAPAPDWVLERLVAPITDPVGASCETGSGDAIFRERSGRTGPTLFGVWKVGDESTGPSHLAVLDRGLVSVGRRKACSEFGLGLGPGPHQFEIREWQGDRFGPGSRIAFEIPPARRRGPEGNAPAAPRNP